jgi:nicotinamidase-related amidase
MMHEIHMFDRKGTLTLEGFEGSGADFLERLKPYIEDGKTVIVNPHKVYGPESNDLVLQLRKRGISKVLLGGMSANLCVEAHCRELLEQGSRSRSSRTRLPPPSTPSSGTDTRRR